MTIKSFEAEGDWADRVKVPIVITIYFWIIKILATTVGETAADFLSVNLHLGLTNTTWFMGGLLVVVLGTQLAARRYVPWLYWTAVVLVSIVGTLITDNLTDQLNVPLEASTAVFAAALAVTFLLWYASEKTLSIHSIFTLRREVFYWVAILLTFALGTAGGDLVAERLDWGYALSAFVFGVALLLVVVAYYSLRADAVLAFWTAYILTRPFGASCGDLLAKPADFGGLGLGTVATSAVFLVVILGLVSYLAKTGKDVLLVTPSSKS
jgi:uncharacterized membrane-anchored protein